MAGKLQNKHIRRNTFCKLNARVVRSKVIPIVVWTLNQTLEVKPTQHKILAHYERFEVRRVFRPCLD